MEFIESQRFTKKWHIVLIVGIILLTISSNFDTLISAINTSDFGLLLKLIGSLLVGVFLFFFLQLKTSINLVGIHYQFIPFHRKKRSITWNEIETIAVITYRPLFDYGGWGIRMKSLDGSNIALNISGKIGIYMQLKNGNKLLIGTQKKLEAETIVAHFFQKSTTEAVS
jgi:hypothetical protein